MKDIDKLWSLYGKLQYRRELLFDGVKKAESEMIKVLNEIQVTEKSTRSKIEQVKLKGA